MVSYLNPLYMPISNRVNLALSYKRKVPNCILYVMFLQFILKKFDFYNKRLIIAIQYYSKMLLVIWFN